MSLLERVQRGRTRKPPRILAYGIEGIGKSTFASEAPKPIFVQTEDGLDEIHCDRFPLATRYDDVISALAELQTEQHAYESIVIDSLDWLERLIWDRVCQESGKRGRGREATTRPLPPSVLDTARWWAQFQPGQRSGNLSLWHPEPKVVDQTAEAAEVLATYRGVADDEYARAEERGNSAAMAIWARAYEKARRLALLYACSEKHVTPVIHQEAATWACAFVAHQTKRMLFMAGCHTSESDFDAKRKRLLEVLTQWFTQHGDQWMPFWMINRKLPWTSREHQEVRDTLVSQRFIEARTLRTSGRPGLGYRLKPSSCAAE